MSKRSIALLTVILGLAGFVPAAMANEHAQQPHQDAHQTEHTQDAEHHQGQPAAGMQHEAEKSADNHTGHEHDAHKTEPHQPAHH